MPEDSSNPGDDRALHLHELELIDAAYADAFTSSHADAGANRGEAVGRDDTFPGYEVVRIIRRGAQGIVYEAIQQRTNRRVAIKLIYSGDIASHRVRFEREVQALGRFAHPCIVNIHDSVATGDRAYFVMDYVDGASVDEYLKSHVLSVRSILELFAAIGDAVNAAHLQGVIHRDLKPGNIRIDASGTPRILDFGLAKTLSPGTGQGQDDVLTQTGQFVGSLPWASPEQTQRGEEGIDIRTDVYSLGVMLYHALTLEFPYTVTGNMRAVVDNICTQEPKRPRGLRADIDDEVETIVLKCLAKERSRRYQTAGELIRDLMRYLAGEPIEAKRDSTLYWLRKTMRRHRLPVAVAGGLILLLALFAVMITVLYKQVEQQRDEALAARQAEAIARQRSETEAVKAVQVQVFLREMLRSASPFADDADISMLEALNGAAQRIDAQPMEDPQVAAGIRHALSIGYQGVGAYAEAEAQLREADRILSVRLTDDHADVLLVRQELAKLLQRRGALDDAEALAQEVADAFERMHGLDHPDTLASAFALAWIWYSQGRFAEAETLTQSVLQRQRKLLGPQSGKTLETMSGLGSIYKALGRLADAEALLREALASYEATVGPTHAQTQAAITNLATVLQDQGKLDEAEMHYRRSLAMQRESLGDDHPYTLITMNNLASLLRDAGHFADAEPILREVVAKRTALLGPAHMSTLTSMNNLALVLMDQKQLDEAEAIYLELLDIGGEAYGQHHPEMLVWASNLLSVYAAQKRWDEAGVIARQVLDGRLELLGDAHPRTLIAMNNYAVLLLRAGDLEAAVTWSKRAWETAQVSLPEDHYTTFAYQTNYGHCLAETSAFETAEPLLVEAYESLAEIAGPQHPYTRRSFDYVIELYEDWGRPEAAAPYIAARGSLDGDGDR
jgi:tetratricopeptide (TPR) repeat protein/tRNA A-37 threonylcarbamoyl transferase component Bud32